MKPDVLEAALCYQFHSKQLIAQAVTHRSYAHEMRSCDTARQDHNERLEFLGDAVLEVVIRERLLMRCPQAREGTLSILKSQIISATALAHLARQIHLDDHLILGKGEEKTAGRQKDSLLADAFEAIMAAVYLDGGFDAARAVIHRLFEESISEVIAQETSHPADCKTILQEHCQRLFQTTPTYRTLNESGPDHKKTFEVEVSIGQTLHGIGMGGSKKAAEQQAAQHLLQTAAFQNAVPVIPRQEGNDATRYETR